MIMPNKTQMIMNFSQIINQKKTPELLVVYLNIIKIY